ncbi:hypothetical protein SteCoe_34148 [Stentor coeruleus]|uniref:Uncharacterized protein n=1 Tax=Stentor coeruleus TaxID=5963 RepID=A0A1R2AV62_9CILI|nr:hypothetical protein SteCoe_34148 [Stentor coeruleus]
MQNQSKKTIIESRKESRPPSSTPIIRRKKQFGAESETKIQDLLDALEEEKKKNLSIYHSSMNMQEKCMKREKEFKRTITEYEKLLIPARDISPQDSTGKYSNKIKKTHQKILEKIDFVQKQTVNYLHEQEKYIVKELNYELNVYQRKAIDAQKNHSKEVVSCNKATLHQEIIKNRAKVEVIESQNNYLHKTNKELKIECKSHENDVSILNLNLERLKKQNLKLKYELDSLKEKQLLTKTLDSNDITNKGSLTDRIMKTRQEPSLIQSLKRMIEIEKKNLRAAKNAYSRELSERCELESIIRSVLDSFTISPKSRSGTKESSHSRILQDKREIIQLLYTKTFPTKKRERSILPQDLDSEILIEHLDKNIENIEKLYSQHEELMQMNTERAHIDYDNFY